MTIGGLPRSHLPHADALYLFVDVFLTLLLFQVRVSCRKKYTHVAVEDGA